MTSIRRGRSITRTTALPALVLVLALAAIGAITLLQERSDSSDDAQLKLATIRVELNRLQTAPFGAQASTGGSPLRAATLMRTGKQRIAGTLGELRRKSPPPALSRLSAPLRANYAALDRIYVLGATGASTTGGPRAHRRRPPPAPSRSCCSCWRPSASSAGAR